MGPCAQITPPNDQFHDGDGAKSLLSRFPKEAFAAQLKADLGCGNRELLSVPLLSPCRAGLAQGGSASRSEGRQLGSLVKVI